MGFQRHVLHRPSNKMLHLITTALCWQSIYNQGLLHGSPDHSQKPWGVLGDTPRAFPGPAYYYERSIKKCRLLRSDPKAHLAPRDRVRVACRTPGLQLRCVWSLVPIFLWAQGGKRMVLSHTTLSGPEDFVPIVSPGWGSGCQLCSDRRGPVENRTLPSHRSWAV